MEFGGDTFSGRPFTGIAPAYAILCQLNIIFPTDFIFFGAVGDIAFLPPGLTLPIQNMNDRLSPCLVFANESM